MSRFGRVLAGLLTVVVVGGAGGGGGGCGGSVHKVDVAAVKSETIHQSYAVEYDAATNTTAVAGHLRVGGSSGTNVVLSGLALIECNGQPLIRGGPNGFYQRSVPGFAGDYRFVFTDAAGAAVVNTVRLAPIDFDPATPDRLTRATVFDARFVGPPLGAGEEARLEVDRAEPRDGQPAPPADLPGRSWRPLATAQAVGATGVTLGRADLAALANGPAQVRWVRTVEAGLQAAFPPGGRLGGTYRSAARELVVTD